MVKMKKKTMFFFLRGRSRVWTLKWTPIYGESKEIHVKGTGFYNEATPKKNLKVFEAAIMKVWPLPSLVKHSLSWYCCFQITYSIYIQCKKNFILQQCIAQKHVGFDVTSPPSSSNIHTFSGFFSIFLSMEFTNILSMLMLLRNFSKFN